MRCTRDIAGRKSDARPKRVRNKKKKERRKEGRRGKKTKGDKGGKREKERERARDRERGRGRQEEEGEEGEGREKRTQKKLKYRQGRVMCSSRKSRRLRSSLPLRCHCSRIALTRLGCFRRGRPILRVKPALGMRFKPLTCLVSSAC